MNHVLSVMEYNTARQYWELRRTDASLVLRIGRMLFGATFDPQKATIGEMRELLFVWGTAILREAQEQAINAEMNA